MLGKTKQVILFFSSVVLLLAAAGCTGNEVLTEPMSSSAVSTATAKGSLTTASPSPTAKPSPTPIPASSKGPAKNWPVPKMPEIAQKKSQEGIKAFTEYYYNLIEYTLETNDTAPIKKITKRTCIECGNGFIDPSDNNKKAGSWISGANFDVVVTKTTLQPDQGIALFTTTQGEMTLYMSDGTLQGVFPATPKPAPLMMLLTYEKGWFVESLEYLDESY